MSKGARVGGGMRAHSKSGSGLGWARVMVGGGWVEG